MNDRIKQLAADADAKQAELHKLDAVIYTNRPSLERVRYIMVLEKARAASYAADQTLKDALTVLDAALARDAKIDGNQEARQDNDHARYRDEGQRFEAESGGRE
jgi:hypothetical protein